MPTAVGSEASGSMTTFGLPGCPSLFLVAGLCLQISCKRPPLAPTRHVCKKPCCACRKAATDHEAPGTNLARHLCLHGCVAYKKDNAKSWSFWCGCEMHENARASGRVLVPCPQMAFTGESIQVQIAQKPATKVEFTQVSAACSKHEG